MSISEETQAEELNNPKTEAQDFQPIRMLQDSIAANYGDSDIGAASASLRYARSKETGGTAASRSYDAGISLVASLIVSLMQKVDDMTQEMRSLKEAVFSIERAISVEESGDEDESAIEVTREEAKEMVVALFHEKGQLGYSEIMSTLRLDLELIVEICAELEADGKIEGVD